MCDRLDIMYKYYAYDNTLYACVWSEKEYICIRLFLLAKTSFMLVCSQYMIIPT